VNNYSLAKGLLREREDAVPEGVIRTIDFLSGHGVDFRLSRNRPVTSCRDAANARQRLGKVGIPLWDEMKSAVYEYLTSSGESRVVCVHCRGDRRVLESELAAHLGAEGLLNRMRPEKLQESFDMKRGEVTPFSKKLADSSTHIFDRDLLRPISVPNTVMTNANDLSWAVEFNVEELRQGLPKQEVVAVSDEESESGRTLRGVRDRRTIGIITGNGPESGMLLWELMNEHIRFFLGTESGGDVSMPPVVVYSRPEMGLSMELRKRQQATWKAIRETVQRACIGGASLIALACNTTQYFSSRIRQECEKWGARFISIPDCLELFLRKEGIRRARLAGIGLVALSKEMSAFGSITHNVAVAPGTSLPCRNMNGVQLFPFPLGEIRKIEEIAWEIKQYGYTAEREEVLLKILNAPDPRSIRHKKPLPVIFALTELSIILHEARKCSEMGSGSKTRDERRVSGLGMGSKFGKRLVVDTLAVLAEALALEYLGLEAPNEKN
jgi:prolyl-tRNA editing enzyme YbaK/EbsC (Cys-tRNA(Pro) deacylase)